MSTMVTYSLTITSVKISLLLLYRRIFTTASFKPWYSAFGVACVMWLLAQLFAGIFQCRPFDAAFEADILFTDRCINLEAYYRGVTASNLGLDIIALCLPLPMIWRLQLSRRQKLGLTGIFLLGSL